MMKRLTISYLMLLPFVALALAVGGCTGSGTGTTGGGGTGGTANTVNRVDPNLSNVDVTRQSASSSESVGLSASKSVAKAESEVSAATGSGIGDLSTAGCVGRQLVDESIRMSKGLAAFNCYIETAEEKIKEFTCAKEDFSNYQFNVVAGGPQDKGFALRVRCKAKGGTRTVHLCEGSSGSFKQTEGFRFTTNSTTGVISYFMKHHFTSDDDGNDDPCDGNNDGSKTDSELANCRIGGNFDEWGEMTGSADPSSTAIGELDNIGEFDLADVTGLFNGNFGNGSLTFIYDADGGCNGGQVNKVKGAHNFSFGSNDIGTDFIYCELNSSEGSCKFSSSGTLPAVLNPASHLSGFYCPLMGCDVDTQSGCTGSGQAASCYCLVASASANCTFTHSGTEHFAVSLGSNGKPVFKIASTSCLAANVAATALPTAVDSITKNFGTEAWDCSSSNGFTAITLGDEAGLFPICFDLESAAFDQSDQDDCFKDKYEADIQQKAQ